MCINTYIYIYIPAWQIYVKFEKTQDYSCLEEEEVSMSWVFGKGVVRQRGALLGFGRTYKCGDEQEEHPSRRKLCRSLGRQEELG